MSDPAPVVPIEVPSLPGRALHALNALAAGATDTACAATPGELRAELVATVVRAMFALLLEGRGHLAALDNPGAPTRPLSRLLRVPPPAPFDAAQRLFRCLHEGVKGANRPIIHPMPGRLFDVGPGHVRVEDTSFLRALECLGALDHALYARASVETIGQAYESLIGWDLVPFDHDSMPPVPGFDLLGVPTATTQRGAGRVRRVAQPLGRNTPVRKEQGVRQASPAAKSANAPCTVSSPQAPCLIPTGSWVVCPSIRRRRTGSHYTSPELARMVVTAALQPLIDHGNTLPLLCDPAAGTGAFLVAAGRMLVQRHGSWAQVLARCLHGVDTDAFAIEIARVSLAIESSVPGARYWDTPGLCCGDALDLDWAATFPDAAAQGGFDAVVGNPPWVAYAGRAAQPLDPARFGQYRKRFESFRGYRTLHGMFVELGADLLRPDGRLGLILPTSVADLHGYAPVRMAHDTRCDVDPDLPDLGADAFRGVFQPAMVLLSTRRSNAVAVQPPGRAWPLARHDLDPVASGLLARLDALTPMPRDTFAERGYQSVRQDTATFVGPDERTQGMVPIREGGDIGPFVAYPPRWFVDPAKLRRRLRTDAEWREVDVLVRQTARYPIAACSDGIAFRNSILAGFARAPWTRYSLVAYLNSTPVRWLHYVRFRDARQGMPQVKIAHLRAIPDLPPGSAETHRELHDLGERLTCRAGGIDPEHQQHLDRLVGAAWRLDSRELAVVLQFALDHPVPVRMPRRRP